MCSSHRRVIGKEASDPSVCVKVIVGYLGKKPDPFVCVQVIVGYLGKKPDPFGCMCSRHRRVFGKEA